MTKKITKTYTGPAIWQNADHDELVTITGYLGRQNGQDYFSIENSATRIPGNELVIPDPKSGIIRVKKDAKYFVAANEPFNDTNLSWEARGVMGYLLSKPDGWIVRNDDLIHQGPASHNKIKRILRELKDAGYMRRFRIRNDDGTFTWITEIYECKALNPEHNEKPRTIDPKTTSG